MKDKKHSTLILGMGNDILTDDGIGPKLVNKMQETLDYSQVTFSTAALGGLEILEMIRDYAQVIIIDAIRTRNGVPGTVYHLTPAHFKETLHVSNFHDISFLPALEMAQSMGISVTDKIDIIAIEIVEDLTFSNDFSPPIAKIYDRIYLEVIEKVKELIE